MRFGAIRFGSIAVAISVGSLSGLAPCQTPRAPRFNVLAFYTGRHDLAHISFVDDANRWFPATARRHNFRYESTTDWSRLNADSLNRYQVVVFLDTRPDNAAERDAFRRYMERGGAWLGFHFSAFALTPSDYPQNWDWYHNEFLGAGQYVSNTWRPTSAVLRVDAPDHPVVAGLPRTFRSAPNEWYRWERDVRKTPGIRVLLSIDPSSFPLGTGPKPHEIWHSGDYPVVWTNTHYRMVYMNMGHNDMDYEHGTNRQLSSTFAEPVQNELIVRALRWLGEGRGDRLRDVRANSRTNTDENGLIRSRTDADGHGSVLDDICSFVAGGAAQPSAYLPSRIFFTCPGGKSGPGSRCG